MKYISTRMIFISFFSLLLYFGFFPTIYGQTTGDLIIKIEEKTSKIKLLDEEIKQINIEVDNANKEGITLKSTLKTLDLTKKKIGVDINLTDTKINKTVLTIEQLGIEINRIQNNIDVNKEAIINAVQETQRLEGINIIEIILSTKNISAVWNEIDNIEETRDIIRKDVIIINPTNDH